MSSRTGSFNTTKFDNWRYLNECSVGGDTKLACDVSDMFNQFCSPLWLALDPIKRPCGHWMYESYRRMAMK